MNAPSPPPSRKPERLIRVHGTFAARDDDFGDSWWQSPPPGGRTHRFWTGVAARLPDSIVPDKPFHWNGANKECDRQVAAATLLERFVQLENENTAYHVVTHSHGGTVIWAALTLACERRIELPGLRSWTTVGAPFVQFQRTLRSKIVSCSILPILLLIALVIAFLNPDFQSWATEKAEFFGPWGPAVLAAGVAILLVLSGLIFWLRLAFLRRKRDRFQREAAERFGPLWLGLRSQDDEAINALKTALKTRKLMFRWRVSKETPPSHPWVSQIPGLADHRKNKQPAPRSDRQILLEGFGAIGLFLGIIAIAFFLPASCRQQLLDSVPGAMGPLVALVLGALAVALRKFYNHAAAPLMDKTVHGWLCGFTHGNDTRAFAASTVSSAPPVGKSAPDCPPLPEEIDRRLVKNANESFVEALSSARRLLLFQATIGSPDLAKAADETEFGLDSGDLVHTSYFEDPDILSLVLTHVLSNSAAGLPEPAAWSPWIAWFQQQSLLKPA